MQWGRKCQGKEVMRTGQHTRKINLVQTTSGDTGPVSYHQIADNYICTIGDLWQTHSNSKEKQLPYIDSCVALFKAKPAQSGKNKYFL